MTSFESNIIVGIQKISSPALNWVFNIITQGGEIAMILIVFAVVLLCFGALKAAKYGVIVGVTSLVGQIIKIIVARPRPYQTNSNISNYSISNVKDFTSFPSGHTLTATVTAIFLVVCLFNVVRNKWGRSGIVAAFSLFVLLVGFSRMYLGVHYLSDVLGAILIAAVVYVIISYVFEKVWKGICRRIANPSARAGASSR